MTSENDDELIISYEAPLEPAPEGKHPMVCVDVFMADPEEQTYDGVTKWYEKVMLVFQCFPEDGSRTTEGKPFQVERKFTFSLDPQGKLRPFLESWRGQAFTNEEVRGFSLSRLKGVNAWGWIELNTRFANIVDIKPYDGAPIKPKAYTRRIYKKKSSPPVESSPARQAAKAKDPYVPF